MFKYIGIFEYYECVSISNIRFGPRYILQSGNMVFTTTDRVIFHMVVLL